MSDIRELHDEAMALAEMASVAKLKGDVEQAGKLLRQAYDSEVKAVELIIQEVSPEPTRSILFRSAASLAIDCNEFRQAEKLIATALSGNPRADIAEELRNLLELLEVKRMDEQGRLDREKMLPIQEIPHDKVIGFAPLWQAGWVTGAEAQQAADWKRVKPLIEALPSIRQALDSLIAEVAGHGVTQWLSVNEARIAISNALD